MHGSHMTGQVGVCRDCGLIDRWTGEEPCVSLLWWLWEGAGSKHHFEATVKWQQLHDGHVEMWWRRGMNPTPLSRVLVWFGFLHLSFSVLASDAKILKCITVLSPPSTPRALVITGR